MKIIKTIGILILICYAQNCFSQIDTMTEDDDDEDLKELSKKGFGRMNYTEFMKTSVYILRNPEAGVLGNWMGDKLFMMHDTRLAEGPKEYKAAFTVKVKTLKIESFNALLEQVNLSCSERKEIIESYILYLGTIFLDTFGMDYFAEKTEYYTNNEFQNIELGSLDAKSFFIFNSIDRMTNEYVRNSLENIQKKCNNDLSDYMVTNCNHKEGGTSNRKTEDLELLGLELLHPLKIASTLTNLQSSLNSLPCKD